MKRMLSVIGVMVLVTLSAAGCAKAPQDEVGAAQADMDTARQAQAEIWAPTEYKAADEALTAANAEIATQGSKWFKNYDKAKELLAQAREEAGKASQAAAANKEQAKKDAEAALQTADSAIQAAEAAWKVAPRTKDSKADLELYKGDLETLKGTLETARQAFGSEDYKKALESAAAVNDQATSIATKLEEAKQKVAGRPVPKK